MTRDKIYFFPHLISSLRVFFSLLLFCMPSECTSAYVCVNVVMFFFLEKEKAKREYNATAIL